MSIKKPLEPEQSLILVLNGNIKLVDKTDITPLQVGLKAYGLCSIPIEWIPPFIVISGDADVLDTTLYEALILAGIDPNGRLIVRSSGVNESIDDRGSLESEECSRSEIIKTILALKEKIKNAHVKLNINNIHWVVQTLVKNQLKGHLSNERRLSHALRDWIVETDATNNSSSESHKLSIRKWRDARQPEIKKIECKYKENIVSNLRSVAQWTHARMLRVHFEWVWDGNYIYIVQADECNENRNGVDPTALISGKKYTEIKLELDIFRTAISEDFTLYRKLANAKLYRDLGYTPINFYILNDNNEIDLIIKDNKCSQELINDLEQLTKRPLVIRTDGLDIPAQQHQMLPRSDELRSCEAAVKWLLGDFRNKILELDLQDKKLCLISHHFIPASASAWCLAQPNKRKVRIESLWGIPEGLYWYAHDVFDVDTKVSSIINQDNKPENFYINERLRYKGRFVAPNDNGEWVVHDVADGFDWKRSIKNKEWIEEIAWTSRKIAIHLKKPVVIMWFIDIPNVISNHAVIPWYHESWKHAGSSPKAAPRKKLPTSEEFILRTKDDWQSLKRLCLEKKQFSRVYIDPTEPDLVRDQKFAKELAGLADKNGFVIELSGGILSHAYYMLKSSGCDVECADLYATDDEEIEYNKLVRDKIPEIIHSHGEDVKLLKLEGDALITALKRKVVEEALEILDAVTSQQLIEEIADLRETINALMSKLDISDNEIEDTRKIKVKERGAFEEGLMLEKTALSPSVDLVVEDEKTDALKFNTSKIERTIAKAEQLPGYFHDIHTDKRHDSKGTFERLFTYFLPAHGEGFNPPKTSFTLESADGSIHEYILDLSLERKGANIYCKIRMINAPKQLTLNI